MDHFRIYLLKSQLVVVTSSSFFQIKTVLIKTISFFKQYWFLSKFFRMYYINSVDQINFTIKKLPTLPILTVVFQVETRDVEVEASKSKPLQLLAQWA